MPDFNYENPANIEGSPLCSPEEQLFTAVLEGLAYDGYAGLDMENIGKRSGQLLLAESYKTKMKLCRAALIDAADRMRLAYMGITEEARAYLETEKKGGIKKQQDEGWKQLERLLYRHIYLCFHPKNRVYVLVAGQEGQLPEELSRILPDARNRYFGEVLSRMILAVSEVKSRQLSAMIACSICGGIDIFVHEPEYCKELYNRQTGQEPNYALVEDLMNNYFLRAVAANTAVNKLF